MKFGLIGCGRIAERHAELITRHGTLVAVCDIIKEKADALGLGYGATAYYDIDVLLLKETALDLVVVCTPNGLHALHSIRILQSGKHVLCEKPMAITSADCRQMIEASKIAGKNLFIVKQNRFNPPVQAVKKLLDEGKLGKVYSIQLNCFWNRDPAYYHNSWKGTMELDRGLLFTQFSHFIDLLYWVIGDVKKVNAFADNYAHKGIVEFEDTGVAIMEFENGVIGTLNYTVNSFRKNMEGSLTIFAEKGTVKIGGEYLNRIDYQNIEDHVILDLSPGNGANNYGSYQGSMSNHDRVYENLVGHLKHSQPVYISSLEGLKTVEIIEKIYSASANNSSERAVQHV